jgi:hypothetical protein
MIEQYRWRKSTRSGNQTNCVEVAVGETVGVRDTKNRAGGALAVPASGWSAFLDAVKARRES